MTTYLSTDPQALGFLAWASAAITLLGFTLAIWQIARVKRAADAARDAALGLVQRVRSRELLAKLGDAHNHLDAARNHVASGGREIAVLCLELSRRSMIEARQLSREVFGDRDEFQLTIVQLREAERRLAVMSEPLEADSEFVRMRMLLRDVSESLQRRMAQARYAYDVNEE